LDGFEDLLSKISYQDNHHPNMSAAMTRGVLLGSGDGGRIAQMPKTSKKILREKFKKLKQRNVELSLIIKELQTRIQ